MDHKLALKVRNPRVLEKAWGAIHRNARTSKSQDTKDEIANFSSDLHSNLRRINRQLQRKTFVFPPAKGLKIPKDKKDKSKFRPLVLAKVESRVVQRAIHDVLVTVPEIQKFVRTPHSFGGVKKSKDDELAAVPAAIQEILNAIGSGAKYIIRSDIKAFFTRISKSSVTEIVEGAIADSDFMALFKSAIAVELENMAQLRAAANAFPIEDIGVAQGNSLSPLLGNIILYDFDRELNQHSDVRCIRYIDDFIILAPNRGLAENTYAKALHILGKLGMETSPHKTKKANVGDGFDFLGIDLSNGFIRPSKASQDRMIGSVKKTLSESAKAFRAYNGIGDLERSMSLLQALSKVSGIMQGWAKHYRFCNDSDCLKRLDEQISELIRSYLAIYREEREKVGDLARWKLLGVEALSQIERNPFVWPKKKSLITAVMPTNSLPAAIENDPNSLPWL